MRFLLILLGGWWLAAEARAQSAPLDTLFADSFRNNHRNWAVGDQRLVVSDIGPAGYHLRFAGTEDDGTPMFTQTLALNDQADYSIELTLRGRGQLGLIWGYRRSRETDPPSRFYQLALDLTTSPARVALWQRANDWLNPFAENLPASFDATAEHTLRVDRSGGSLRCYVDGRAVGPVQPAGAWPGPDHDIGVYLEKPGAEVWLRRLVVRHRSLIRVVPGAPRQLRRERLAAGINTTGEELAPSISADGRHLFFTRSMGNPAVALDSDTDIYEALRSDDGRWGEARSLGAPVNTPKNNNVHHISPDGQTLLLIGQYRDAGQLPLRGGLSLARRRAEGGWQQPVAITAELTLPDEGHYMTRFIDASGTVAVVASDTKDHIGKSDLYFSLRRPDGSWPPLTPLGAVINTPGDEETPFLAPDGKTLYFSSDTHPGYGSHDVFMSTRLDDSWTSWSPPLNLGPGVNTWRKEANFTLPASGEYAYFISKEPGAGRYDTDIYRLLLPPALKPAPTLLVRGRLLDARTGRAVPNAQLRYEQLPEGREVGRLALGGGGTYEMALPAGAQYGFRAEAEGYVAAADNLDLTTTTSRGEISRDLYLLPVVADVSMLESLQLKLPAPAASDTSMYASLRLKSTGTTAPPESRPAGSPPGTLAALQLAAPAAGTTAPARDEARLVLHNVFFEQGKPVLLPASFPELKRLAQTLKEHPALRLRLEGHTDNQGDASKNQVLSEQRVAEIKKYLIRQQVAADRLETIGYGPTRPVAPNDVEPNRRRNRRVEFVILQR